MSHVMSSHGGHMPTPALNEAQLNPFSRLLDEECNVYDQIALTLLAGALGPMQAEDASDKASKPTIPAGFTIVLQLVDHDLTEQIANNLSFGTKQRVAPEPNPTLFNGRTGRIDLDSLYGRVGQESSADPELIANDKFILSKATRPNGAPRDIERDTDFADGRRIAELRNDENVLIVQMHILFARLHNLLIETGYSFDKSMDITILTWQRIIFADVLPRIVRSAEINKVKDKLKLGKTFYQAMNARVNAALPVTPEKPVVAMPVEFAGAAFRLGHSLLNNTFQVNSQNNFVLFRTFPDGGVGVVPEPDLAGNQAITDDKLIEFDLFFGTKAQQGEPLDTRLPASVFRLPPRIGVFDRPISLALRNIQRAADFGVPSGQTALAEFCKVYSYIPAVQDLAIPQEVIDQDPLIGTRTPLFYYVLREAEELNPEGSQLGPLGGLIVGETILGSLVESGFDVHQSIPSTISLDEVPKNPPEMDGIWTMVELLTVLDELKPRGSEDGHDTD